jgi:glutaredoxin
MFYKVYGISDCPSCLRACADLMEKDMEYVFINCDFAKTYRNEIREQFNWSTFPIIIRETSQETLIIGGHDELATFLNQ